jgi:CubicO group peptidase (beta-lactamase class C family)
MRIRDLLMHTSGLTYGFMNRTNVDHAYRRLKVGGEAPGETLQDMIDKMAKLPLEFSPGSRWNYSHATDVLGFLIERLTGEKLDDYLQANIFDPLGMSDTGFTVKDVSRFAANYARGRDKKLIVQDDPETSLYTKPKTFLGGGGGLVSTAADYLSFCRCLMAGGELNGERIIGQKTLSMMTRNHLPNNDDLTQWATGSFSEIANEGYGFGLGFSIHLGSERSATIGSKGDYAWGGAASTIFWVDPAEELIVIFMTQFMPSGTFNFRGQLKALVYPAIR